MRASRARTFSARWLAAALLLPLLALLLTACITKTDEGFSMTVEGEEYVFPPPPRRDPGLILASTTPKGAAKLVLNPLDVWDVRGASELAPMPVVVNRGSKKEEEMHFRVRTVDFFDRADVRMGLYWDAHQRRVYVPLVVVSRPVRVRAVRIVADGYRETLEAAPNLKFQPVPRAFEKVEELNAFAYAISPETLEKIATAREVQLAIATDRGNLNVHLGVATSFGGNPPKLTQTAKVQFARFYRRMQALR